MRVYQRAGKFDLTDDEGHLIQAGFDTEAAALHQADLWRRSKEWWDKQPSRSTLGPIPVEPTPLPVTLDVPLGRSWFVTRVKAIGWEYGWEVEEHRVAAAFMGTEALTGKDAIRRHQCASEGELTRLRRSLAGQGLFDRGIEELPCQK